MSVPPIDESSDETPILETTVSYFNVITGQQHSVRHTATISRPASGYAMTRNVQVDRQLNRVFSAEAMDTANEAARAGDLERARDILRRTRDRIMESVSKDDPFCQSLVADLGRCEAGLSSHAAYRAGGAHTLTNQMQGTSPPRHFE